jgi:hypothetical protein
MIIIDFLKNNYKYPKFWIIIFILLVIITVIIFISIKNNPPTTYCRPDEQRYPKCGNKCGAVCTSGLYDCVKGCINCDNIDDSPCGDESCCPPNQCNTSKEGVSCCSGTPCGTKDKPQCCGVDESCQNGSCVANCGYDSKGPVTCRVGQTCIHVSGATDDMWARFQNDFKNDNPIHNGSDMYACAVPTCTSKVDKTFPSTVAGKVTTFLPCTKLINIGDQGGDVGYCTSKDSTTTNAYDCWSKSKNNNCFDNNNCIYKSIYNTSFDEMQNDSNNIFKLTDTTQKYEGNWCGDTKNSIVQYSQSEGGKKCSYIDCWNKIGTDEGVVNVDWNQNTGICTGLINCADKIVDNQYLTKCDYSKKPNICSDSGTYFNCNNDEIWSNSTNPCSTQGGNCHIAITNGLGWCVRKDGTQQCVTNSSDCKKDNFDTYFDDIKFCPIDNLSPLANNIIDNSVGFKCNSNTTSCSETAFNYLVYIENRTPFTYNITYIDPKNYACDDNHYPLTLLPLSGKVDDPPTVSYGRALNGIYDTSLNITCIDYPSVSDGFNVAFDDTGKPLKVTISTLQQGTDFNKYVICDYANSYCSTGGAINSVRIVLYMSNMYPNQRVSIVCNNYC